MPKALCPEQVAAYRKHGYVLPAVEAVSPAEAATLREELEAVEHKSGQHGAVSLAHGHARYPWLHRLVTCPAILDAVEDLIGGDILVWSLSVFTKEPNCDVYIGWHQDSVYWGLKDDTGPLEVVTAWVALSAVGPDAGPMQFLRGSHLQPLRPQTESYDARNLLSRGQEIVWSSPIDENEVATGMFSHQHFLYHASLT